MIGEYTFLSIFDTYGINYENISSIKQDRILTRSEYISITAILDFLIREKMLEQ